MTFRTSPPRKNKRAEARQRQHHERELRIAAPPLPHDLTRRRRPARVADDRMQHVAGAHVLRDRVGERGPLVVQDRKPSRPQPET